MNSILIALILVLILVALYYVYLYFTSFPYLVSSTYDLKTQKPSVPSTALSNLSSIRYTFSTWIYVTNLNNNGAIAPTGTTGSGLTENTLFSLETGVGGSHAIGTNEEYFSLYFQKDSPKLYLHIKGYQSNADYKKSSHTDRTAISEIVVSDNFPLQSWTSVIVSVDTYFIDIYINGNLVKSVAINSSSQLPISPIDTNAVINFGKGQDIKITRLMRLPYQTDPGTAYTIFAQGSGQQNSSITHFNVWYSGSADASGNPSAPPQTNLIQV